MTLVDKIIRAHLVSGDPRPGAPVEIQIDQTLTQDATGTMTYLQFEAIGVPRVRTQCSVSYVDHNMLQQGPHNMNDHLYLQSVAAKYGIWFSKSGNGICHQVHLERFAVPGTTLLGADSHTPTCGGIGALAIGAGGLNIALAMAGLPFTMLYPRVIGVHLTGTLPPWVSAKDVILKLLSLLTTKGNVGCVLEYFGEGVRTLSVPQRATITNMGAELGVTTSIFPSDERTREFMKAQARARAWKPLAADPNAHYERVIQLDLSSLEPLAAISPSPDNVHPVRELAGEKVSQVIIGSCTNSSYRDLSIAAALLKGRRVHPDVSLMITPGSRQILQMIARSGVLETFIAAGARILESACGPCIGQGGAPAEGTLSVRTFNRNFPGRSGTPNDRVALVSPEVAAACAITGVMTDPRTLGIPYPEVTEPKHYLVEKNMFIPPPPDGSQVQIFRASTIGEPPKNSPLPPHLHATVLLKTGDKITTDHIMPAGPYLKLRSNIPEYAKVVFLCFNEPGKPTFAERALRVRDAGRHGVILAGESYGQGSSREHAAICPMYLGIKAVIAKSFERIHRDNLINFGILPLLYTTHEVYDALAQDAEFEIEDIRGQLQRGDRLVARLPNGSSFSLHHTLTPREIEVVLAGGMLNLLSAR
ncbi:MAG: aconitate hydratase [bacterium]|nr:aconitate hydratase [bacterium]